MCGMLSNKSYAYPLFKALFSIGMKFGYPTEDWTVEQFEKSKERIRFNMKSCLYCEELDKRGALEPCPAFCQTDHTTYNPLAPAMVFRHENTIANGASHCDFCFECGKGQIVIVTRAGWYRKNTNRLLLATPQALAKYTLVQLE